jgi:gamma-glutamyl hercynylcysteine S-oxide synthase
MQLRVPYFLFSFVLLLVQTHAYGQLQKLEVENLRIKKVIGEKSYSVDLPLVSYEINGKTFLSNETSSLKLSFTRVPFETGVKGEINLANISRDTLRLTNVVPFGRSDSHVFITGLGDHRLSRTHLFLQGKKPVNVIVPDNAWELGYASVKLDDIHGTFGLARRDLNSLKNATRKILSMPTIIQGSGRKVYAWLFRNDHFMI